MTKFRLTTTIGSLMLALTLLRPTGAGAQASSPHPIPHIDATITLDGIPDEAVWNRAWSHDVAFEISPSENIPAPVRTEVMVFHSRTHLYVGFRAFDPDPAAIRAHLTDRDTAWSDDWIGVVLDTFNDERRDYLLAVNPLGVQMDQIENFPNSSTVWDGIWDAAAQITEWGWGAELKIPFSTLRFQRAEGPQVWGFDAIRGYPRSVFRQMGAFPRDRNNNCYLCQAVKIEGFEDVSPGKNLEIVPTLTAARQETRSELPDGDYHATDDLELGVTARWGFTPNLTLAGTVNPDFSQVEADARQLDINRPFALFYSEKRPFFMEAADFFATPLDVVYTRTIRDPSWGVKLTGKEGEHTVGAYVVEDEVTNLIFPGSQGSAATSLEQSNVSAVLRYKKDFGSDFTLGTMLTFREGEGYDNRVVGIDGDLRVTSTDRVIFQLIGSSTRYPEEVARDFGQPAGDFRDWGLSVYYSHDTRSLSWWAMYNDLGTELRADLGFLPQVDYRHAEAGASYTWIGNADTWYSELFLIGKYAYEEDQDGELLNEEYAVRFDAQGPLQSHAQIRPSHEREGYAGEVFDIDKLLLHVCLKPNGHSHAWLNLTVGDGIDYVNVQKGDLLYFNTGFWYRLGRHLFVQPDLTMENLDVADGWLYEARISQLTTTWQFNARSFVRAILQHVDYEHNVSLYADDRNADDEHLFTQLLFSYKINPQTVFFLGYSDNSIGTQDFALTRADRTVFAKVGYAWVF